MKATSLSINAFRNKYDFKHVMYLGAHEPHSTSIKFLECIGRFKAIHHGRTKHYGGV